MVNTHIDFWIICCGKLPVESILEKNLSRVRWMLFDCISPFTNTIDGEREYGFDLTMSASYGKKCVKDPLTNTVQSCLVDRIVDCPCILQNTIGIDFRNWPSRNMDRIWS